MTDLADTEVLATKVKQVHGGDGVLRGLRRIVLDETVTSGGEQNGHMLIEQIANRKA